MNFLNRNTLATSGSLIGDDVLPMRPIHVASEHMPTRSEHQPSGDPY
ncbi:hypothetical protein [Novipirellula artificiosorum]|nr:hypothetical protein [Novipirellula artificiosorum]